MERATLRKLFSLLAFVVSLIYLYRSVEPGELLIALRGARYGYLLFAGALSLLNVLLSATRWYIVLRRVQNTDFKRTVQAFVSGYYLMAILPPTLGHMAKVKLVGGDYFRALSSLTFGMAAETVVVLSLALIFLDFTKLGLLGLSLIVLAFIYDGAFNRTALAFFDLLEKLGAGRISRKLRGWWRRGYTAWKRAREARSSLLAVFLFSALGILLQIFGLIIVGKAFSLEIPFGRAFYAFVISVVFASLSGIPSGIGANESGILVGIGSSTKAFLTAFSYKFLFQYAYSIAGAFVFYRMLNRRGDGNEDSTG
ncbi:ABC transporter [Thermococcus sp. P6]|uniref:lysylphosphatidylglycerol synthase transmembrane domain-containing protein n=1 Tax=Thermococcus sp. P6 TaxID=122420 RepID=UPI000B59C69C|nr:lysylphosphatidylglycerol synthase transmembrane domain-containing protein [Thermococcus sp. P6]ASJ09864.1 ABC transporter [Thermococcus sp. P6]